MIMPTIPFRDVHGRRSRTADAGQLLLFLNMAQGILAVNGLPIPQEYMWIMNVVNACLGQYIIYLRMNTSTAMQR